MWIWEVWLGVPLYTYLVRAIEGVYLRVVKGSLAYTTDRG